MKRTPSHFSLLLAALISASGGAWAAAASEISVFPGQHTPSDSTAPSIREALDRVDEGGTIWLAPGIYRESVSVNKSVRLAANRNDGTAWIVSGASTDHAFKISAAPIEVELSGIGLRGFSTAIDASEAMGARILLEDLILKEIKTGIRLGQDTALTVTACDFRSTVAEAIRAEGQFRMLQAYGNLFHGGDVYTSQDGHVHTSPGPAFSSNWYAGEFSADPGGSGIIESINREVSPHGANQRVIDTQVIAQFDRDADGLPDAVEITLGVSDFRRFDTDNDGLPDGLEYYARHPESTERSATTELTLDQDSDGDGYVDWYERTLGHDSLDPTDHPALGDVHPNGAVDLGDAVVSLQFLNDKLGEERPTVLPQNIDVTGRAPFSLANPLQILRFQAGVRKAFPAIPGIE